MELRGKRATVMGLGRHGGGVAAARWLAEQGARVTITDQSPAAALAESIASLSDVPIHGWQLGAHRQEAFDDTDLVVVNPAVRLDNPFVARARAAGAQISSELEFFLEHAPGTVIGVTGSNGKSTTTAMIGEILRADGRRTYVGGNIGRSLLPDLVEMDEDSWSVVEISSFQLAWLSAGCPLPPVAVLTNFSANHLDWHGDLPAYAAAKQRLFAGVRQGGSAAFGETIPAGWHIERAIQVMTTADASPVPRLRVPGEHNRRNARLAATTAALVDCAAASIATGLERFAGLPHRLELVATIDDRAFYNDSMATTPESTIAAVATFPQRCWLLVGGKDKGIDMAALCGAIARSACGVAFYGASGPRLHAELQAAHSSCCATCVPTIDEAFAWCCNHARAGESVLLSPACASYDQFVDYRERGARFRALVEAHRAARECAS